MRLFATMLFLATTFLLAQDPPPPAQKKGGGGGMPHKNLKVLPDSPQLGQLALAHTPLSEETRHGLERVGFHAIGDLAIYGPLRNVLGMSRIRIAYTADYYFFMAR